MQLPDRQRIRAALRPLVLGSPRTRWTTALDAVAVGGLFTATFLAWALDLFAVSGRGCLVVIPPYAFQIGIVAAASAGFARRGCLVAWLAALAPNLAYLADDAFLGHDGWSVVARLGHFVAPEGLVYFAIVAAVVGVLGFAPGAVANWLVRELKARGGIFAWSGR